MSRLNQGQELSPGQSLYSPNRKYRLIYQSDGNLVLYRNADEFALWSTKTHGQSAGKLIMQTDGNLVVYNARQRPLWASIKRWDIPNPPRGLYLVMQDDANAVIYNEKNIAVWSSGTYLEAVNHNPEGIPYTLVMTNFDPAKHGFRFNNNFTVQTQFAGLNGPTFSGLCGGMVYTVLDYFNANIPIPSQDYMPAEGMPLQSYLYHRQQNSVIPNIDKWVELTVNPFGWRNREFFNWGIEFGGGRLGELMSKIDKGEPVPLGLKSSNGPGDHQVLAIGYDLGGYKGDVNTKAEEVTLYIYDPNFRGEIQKLKPRPAEGIYVYEKYPQSYWRSYFTDLKYKKSTPPKITGTPNELIVTFKTGGDDLRGGNDNVHFVLLKKSGEEVRFDNINGMKRWVDWSTQTCSRPLPSNLNVNDLAGCRIETTFSGGWGGDNWNLDILTVQTRLNNTKSTLLHKAGAPLVRFTGSRKNQEFRF